MATKSRLKRISRLDSEHGAIRKSWRDHIRVVLVYPNTYHVAMSSLGFQTVYALLNRMPRVVCERVFLPDKGSAPGTVPQTFETGRKLREADIVACSVSFENDYPNLLTLLDTASIPLLAEQRTDSDPLLIAGGAACLLNPEPLAPIFDCLMIGEAEVMLTDFIRIYEAESDRLQCLRVLAREVPGAYVPAFYRFKYHRDGTVAGIESDEDLPATIRRAFVPDLSELSTCSTILTPDTTFARTHLVEVSRGCPHGCRFCGAGFVYRPPRFRPLDSLKADVARGAELTDRIGLVGAAVSDLPDIDRLCGDIEGDDIRLSFSSLRADALSPDLVRVLRESRVKTATIAPDAGSQRLRDVINKGIDEETVLNAAETLVAAGIPNLKLYFMLGLPTETPGDVAAIPALCKRIKHRFLKTSRGKGRIGAITVSLNCFVPKPFTPFQWAPMAEVKVLKQKIKLVRDELKRVANVRVHADIPRWAYVQGLLARGDRRVTDILMLAHRNGGNWSRALKSSPINPDFYVLRERNADEIFPWDIIAHGIDKSFLHREYRRALRAETSPPCPVDPCVRCGVCQGETGRNPAPVKQVTTT